MKEYTVITEKGAKTWSAYVSDLPVCVAVADTREEVEQLIREAIDRHVQDLQETGQPVPEPTHYATNVVVAA
ncbi:MAG: type II toxin-antitoxin system HicB family antitoxin [Armatimonadota bacterium]|nr:type II toxin-antitoxin system HicB family antitoxin [Armatimonadota bacterium]